MQVQWLNKRTLGLVLACGSLLYLNSCKLGKELEEPSMSVPEAFTNDTLEQAQAATDTVAWWLLFEDTVLNALVNEALENNRDLGIAMQRVEQARLQTKISKADFGPKFNMAVQAGRGNYQGLLLPNPSYNFFAGTSMNWELDLWGKYRNLNDKAKSELVASAYGQQAIELSLISEVSRQYFLLLEYETSLDVALKTTELRKETVEIIQARFDQGIVAEIDLNQSQIQYEIARSSIPVFERLVKITKLNINLLTGSLPRDFETQMELESAQLKSEIPTGIPAQVLARRPDVQQAWYQALAQNSMIGVAQANRLPALSLSGTLGLAGNDFSDLGGLSAGWNLGGSLLGPIFYWNQNLRAVDIQRSLTRQQVLNYENTVLTAVNEVEASLITIETAKTNIEASESRTIAAVNALDLSNQRYDQGVTSYLEVLESQRQAFDAELNLAKARSALLQAYVALYKSTGGGWTRQ